MTLPSTSYASSVFVAYDLGEMAFNNFKHLASEFGYRFDNSQSLRLSYFNVALSERHLSSAEASAVDGDNVKGLWHGVDIFFPITKKINMSPSIGYHNHKYSHTILEASVSYSSPTVGIAITYQGDNVFGFDELYWKFSVAFNYNFKSDGETLLGDATVRGGSSDYYPQLFIGYEFD